MNRMAKTPRRFRSLTAAACPALQNAALRATTAAHLVLLVPIVRKALVLSATVVVTHRAVPAATRLVALALTGLAAMLRTAAHVARGLQNATLMIAALATSLVEVRVVVVSVAALAADAVEVVAATWASTSIRPALLTRQS
jgi:hypothetical protein